MAKTVTPGPRTIEGLEPYLTKHPRVRISYNDGSPTVLARFSFRSNYEPTQVGTLWFFDDDKDPHWTQVGPYEDGSIVSTRFRDGSYTASFRSRSGFVRETTVEYLPDVVHDSAVKEMPE